MTASASTSSTTGSPLSGRDLPLAAATSPPSSRNNAASSRAQPRDHSTLLYDQAGYQQPKLVRHGSASVDTSTLKQINPYQRSASSSTSTPSASSPLRRKANMNSDKAEKRRSSRACLECRLAKTKCHVTQNKDLCDRCAKFSFECRFVRHHRGRKPVSKLASVDADDFDAGAGSSRLGGSDDEMLSEHDSDSFNEETAYKPDPPATNEDNLGAIDDAEGDGKRTWDHDNRTAAAGLEQSQRKNRDAASSRPAASRSNSKARSHKGSHSLHELDTHARRRIWEMLAQKIPQRGSTYTFVSKGEVAHDNLQASTPRAGSKIGSEAKNGAPAPSRGGEADGTKSKVAEQSQNESTDAAIGSGQATSKTAAPSQHFASTFRNLLRPVDKRAAASTAAEEAASAVTARYPRLPDTLNLFGPKDPVDLGILSMTAARRLYAYYFEHLNPWGMNFDPYFVSHDAIRASSSFLYSTILYLASRYIELADADRTHNEALPFVGPSFTRPRPDDDRVTAAISAQLGSHVRSLAITAFAMGDRRTETGVAMYLSSVWKEADDHFTILYCSYAAKIMSDIPTELLSLLPSPSTSSTSRSKSSVDAHTAASLHQQRLRRNQQRQFLFHFIQEHTHLLHFAPRPNFDRGPSLLRNLLAWADDGLATEDDVLLCADIDSVLLQTKYKSIMERAQAQEKDTLYGGSECFLLLQSFMDELEGWTSRWELQARKIDQRFRRDVEPMEREDGEGRGDEERDGIAESSKKHDDREKADRDDFAGHLPLDARMHLLSVMRSSLVMQISSIAFRASLRDINKAKPTAASSKLSNVGASSAFSPSALSAMDDRAEQIYYTCLDSALNLLVHTVQMPPSILRHAQDMIMVLAPHAALLATYLISLPLPTVPPNFASNAAASERLSYEYAKVKTRIRRRKEYERKCLELMRDTRDSFRVAQVREDDHVELCAQYFDSLLNVIEGESAEMDGVTRVGRSSGASSVAGTKRSRSNLDVHRGAEEVERPRGIAKIASSETTARASSAGTTLPKRPPHRDTTSNMDTSAAETLLNLHSESQPSTSDTNDDAVPPSNDTSGSPVRLVSGYYGHYLPHAQGTPPGASGAFSPVNLGTGMFGHFTAPGGGGSIPGSPHQSGPGGHRYPVYTQHGPINSGVGGATGFAPATGDFGLLGTTTGGGTTTPTGATGTSTPVDWTWLQSFLDVPEFSWM